MGNESQADRMMGGLLGIGVAVRVLELSTYLGRSPLPLMRERMLRAVFAVVDNMARTPLLRQVTEHAFEDWRSDVIVASQLLIQRELDQSDPQLLPEEDTAPTREALETSVAYALLALRYNDTAPTVPPALNHPELSVFEDDPDGELQTKSILAFLGWCLPEVWAPVEDYTSEGRLAPRPPEPEPPQPAAVEPFSDWEFEGLMTMLARCSSKRISARDAARQLMESLGPRVPAALARWRPDPDTYEGFVRRGVERRQKRKEQW